MYRYTIPFLPPSNNQFIGRENRWEYQKLKKHWAHLIFFTCIPRPTNPLYDVTVSITYFFPDRRRRDPDNYSGKMILDGLVRAGILKDDSFNCIRLLLAAECDKTNPRTELHIY
jgi:crossover junction endodeoxyribonuclease RusA